MTKQIKDADGKIVAELYKDEDVEEDLDEKTIAVIGYASQGRGQGLCYRESSANTILGLRKDGPSWKNAVEEGWKVGEDLYDIDDAVKNGDIIVILVADTAQPELYKEHIEPNLTPGKTLVFSHGFNVHYKYITPPEDVDVVMVAPKGPGFVVRQKFEEGFGVPALVAVHQDKSGHAWDTVLGLAKAIGATRPGVLKTTFKDEVESDLFGEQVDLCGGVMEMVKHAYDTLIESGYNPVLAYWEVHHELHGLIAPLCYRYGNVGMLNRVSLTARKGAMAVGKKVMDDHVKTNMKSALAYIQTDQFAKEWMAEYEEYGFKKLEGEIIDLSKHPLETIGLQVRQIMWPDEKEHQ
ncbi:MAG: ketol-acid reductoisomerase [archaeon]